MQEFDYKQEKDSDSEKGVFSSSVRTGRRTYFFDVKKTLNEDYYLIITESRKRHGGKSDFSFEKQKIFLFKEDFQKFIDGLDSAITFIREKNPDFFETEQSDKKESIESVSKSATDIEFESL